MRIVIVGGGASGLFASILAKEKFADDEVFLFDKNNKVGKKMYVAGSGKCNIGNLVLRENSYNNQLAFDTVNEMNILKFYADHGVYCRDVNGLLYPYSMNAESLVKHLENTALKLGVIFKLNEEVVDYSKEEVVTNLGKYKYDKLIFSTGGKSSPKFGTNGSLFGIFEKHGYKISELKTGLCPIKTKENVYLISGQRVDAYCTLVSPDYMYKESGEVLFKDDGLSGIVIFNIASIISRKSLKNPIISLDLFPTSSEDSLFNLFKILNRNSNDFLSSLFSIKVSSYLLSRAGISKKDSYSDEEIRKFIKTSKRLLFKVKSNYDFDVSEVSVGGISLENIANNFASKIENNVFFIGEVLDIDGLCGGYNLMFALGSAIKAIDSLK